MTGDNVIHPNRRTYAMWLLGLVSVTLCLYPHGANAIYISLSPADLSDNGRKLANDIPGITYPAVGQVTAPASQSTGALLDSVDPKHSWVLTSGHSITDGFGDIFGNDKLKFQPSGSQDNPKPTELKSDQVYRPKSYTSSSRSDLGLIRLDGIAKDAIGKAITPLQLKRAKQSTDLNDFSDQYTLVGFGRTSEGVFGTFGKKRQATFTPDDYTKSLIVVGEDGFGRGTRDDPSRQACKGDSGGPLIFSNGEVGGVLVSVGSNFDAKCGQALSQTAVNTMLPPAYNWIDQYTKPTIFWDSLEIKKKVIPGKTLSTDPLAFQDSFEAGGAGYEYGGTGLPDGWSFANDYSIDIPGIGRSGPNAEGWRYFNATGTDNSGSPLLYIDGESGLGEINTGGGYSLIKRSLVLQGGYEYQLDIEQGWNGENLLGGIGVLFDNQGVWSLFASDPGIYYDPGTWSDRSLQFDLSRFGGPVNVSVVLLNGTVPEPGTLALLSIAGLAAVYVAHRRKL